MISHLLLFQGQENIAKLLIDNGANVDIKGENDRVPLHDAAANGNFQNKK